MSINHDSPLFTIIEAAAYLNMSRTSVYRVIKNHNVPTIQLLPGKQYVTKEALDALISNTSERWKANDSSDN
jgi:excisionase family DNA binding protein